VNDMVYGYVNKFKGENKEFLSNKSIDKIIYHNKAGYDLSFAEKGDKIIFQEIPSVANDLQEFVDFARVVEEIGISVRIGEILNSDELDGKFLIGLFSTVSRYSEMLFETDEQ